MMKLIPYLKLAVEKSASDIFFTTGSPAMLKVDGNMFAIGKQLMTKDLIKELAYSIMTPDQQNTFEHNLEIDLATEAGGLGRFRVNIFNQRGNVAMVLRYVQSKVPTIDELGVPASLRDLIMRKRGLILMVGATGSGKSTTLAAMLDHRNESAGGHILTIEDPIEYLHPNKKSIVNQREIGQDTHSYAAALKSSLREAPDVILVGEIRDRETMEAAIQLAGTGHLCISTLHANNAYQTLQRIINMFPEDLRAQLYMDLSINLRAIVSQRLVRTVEGKRCAAVEVMINTPYIADLILRGEVDGIKETMADSQDRSMQTFDDALYALYKDGRISKEEALANADSAANLESRIAFS